MMKLLLSGLVLVPAQVEAQEKAGRMMLEAGLVGGSGDACPARYVGIKGRIAGPVSLYGMVETYRRSDFAGSGNPHRNVRPARAGALVRSPGAAAHTSSSTSGEASGAP